MKPDREELREIRNELYTIKWMWLADPGRSGLEEIYDEALEELQNPLGIHTSFGDVRFSSRCRDILGTMYTVGKMTGMEEAILRYFDKMQRTIEDNDRDSLLGRVFEALMAVVENHPDRSFYGNDILGLIQQISSRDVASRLESILGGEGEIEFNHRVSTKGVFTLLHDMGFNFCRDRSTNCSLISSADLRDIFEMNLLKYGTDEQREKYGECLTSEHPNKRKNDVRAQCQTAECPNNLTNPED
jgi:hypothetical protein